MNRLREFMGSSSGLALIRLGLSALAGLVILCGARGAVADTECPYTWTVCSASSDCGSADTEGMYRYCTYGLDEDCNFYTVDCWDSSTPCSEAEQGIAPAVLTRKIDCDNQDQWCGAGRDSTEPYRYCINYYKANGDVFGTEACECSATPCSEAEPEPAIAFTGPTNACFNQETECDNQDQWCGAGRDSAEPYRYCTNYYNSEGDIFWRNCECSSTPLFGGRAGSDDRRADIGGCAAGAASAMRCLSQSVQSRDSDSS